MQKPLPTAFLYLLIAFLLQSCSGSNALAVREKALLEAKVDAKDCFVEMKDGTVKNYSTLTLKTSVYKSPHLLADNKTRINPDDIVAYQNKKHYAINASGFSYGGHNSNVASETLPGFAVRVATGHLNVYIKKYKRNGKIIDEYFLQENNGQVLVYSPELMIALVKNNPEALEFFNNNQKRIQLTSELKTTAKIYNDAYFAGHNDDKILLARVEKQKKKPKKF